MRIGRWSEPIVVFVCQLEEVIKQTDANETSGELGVAWMSQGGNCYEGIVFFYLFLVQDI